MSLVLALLLAQATPYPGGDFLYVGGRCLELGPPSGPVHWGLDKWDCAGLAKLDARLNRIYQAKMKSLSAPRRTSLRKAQRAWLAALNATGGIGQDAEIIDAATSTCFATKVRSRIAQLREF
jgi:hypothetical protein